jgi:hypothetical protein
MCLYICYINNTAWVRARLCKLQKGCTRLASASDNVYQLPVNGRRFSPGTPASYTTKTGHDDIAEILLKVALNTINQSINHVYLLWKLNVAMQYSPKISPTDEYLGLCLEITVFS